MSDHLTKLDEDEYELKRDAQHVWVHVNGISIYIAFGEHTDGVIVEAIPRHLPKERIEEPFDCSLGGLNIPFSELEK